MLCNFFLNAQLLYSTSICQFRYHAVQNPYLSHLKIQFLTPVVTGNTNVDI